MGVARALGATVFSVIIGLLMHAIFRKEEDTRSEATIAAMGSMNMDGRPSWQTAAYFAFMIGVLVFAKWGRPDVQTGLWYAIYSVRWFIAGLLGLGFAISRVLWFAAPAWKVGLSATAVAFLALAFPHEPLIPFGAGVAALSVVTTTE